MSNAAQVAAMELLANLTDQIALEKANKAHIVGSFNDTIKAMQKKAERLAKKIKLGDFNLEDLDRPDCQISDFEV